MKIPKWIKLTTASFVIAFLYLIYVHDRIVMSWTAKTQTSLKVWIEVDDWQLSAFLRALVIWGGYFVIKLIIHIFDLLFS